MEILHICFGEIQRVPPTFGIPCFFAVGKAGAAGLIGCDQERDAISQNDGKCRRAVMCCVPEWSHRRIRMFRIRSIDGVPAATIGFIPMGR